MADDVAGVASSRSGVLATTGTDLGRAAPWWAAALVLWGAGLLLVRRFALRRRAVRVGRR